LLARPGAALTVKNKLRLAAENFDLWGYSTPEKGSRLQHLKKGDAGTLVIDNLEAGRNLYMVGTRTGRILRPFSSSRA
jgi:hypothetical protein